MDSNSYLAAIGIALAALLGGYLYLKNVYSYWSKKGIPGPKAKFILGNLFDIYSGNSAKLERDWPQIYGKVYGIFLGLRPRIVIADRELLNQICVKDFEFFTDHDSNEFQNKYFKSFLFSLQGDHWKKVRALMSPTFTSGKIKRMFKLLDTCAEDLVECVNEQLQSTSASGREGVVVNVKDIYNLYAMDAIASCCYAMKLKRDKSGNNSARDEFVEAAKSFTEYNFVRVMIPFVVPKTFLRMINFTVKTDSSFASLISRGSSLIESRRKSGKKFDDYLQLLLDAELDQNMDLNETDALEDHHAGLDAETIVGDQKRMVNEVSSKNKGSKVVMSDLEILSATSFLLSVGLDTTGLLLSNTTYMLAYHQEIQEKLYQELCKIVEFDEHKKSVSFSYETLISCQYLDAVLAESLRYMSPIISLNRRATKDYHLEKYNLHLPKGTVIHISFHGIMNDPENFEEPRKFNPERFMPGQREKIKSGSYCPFGIGPRHCIGMRFSLAEAKLALAKLLMNFRFEPAPGTNFPPEPKMKFVLYSIKNPIVKFVSRRSE